MVEAPRDTLTSDDLAVEWRAADAVTRITARNRFHFHRF